MDSLGEIFEKKFNS